MGVEITVPKEYQSTIASSLGRRKGIILNSEAKVHLATTHTVIYLLYLCV